MWFSINYKKLFLLYLLFSFNIKVTWCYCMSFTPELCWKFQVSSSSGNYLKKCITIFAPYRQTWKWVNTNILYGLRVQDFIDLNLCCIHWSCSVHANTVLCVAQRRAHYVFSVQYSVLPTSSFTDEITGNSKGTVNWASVRDGDLLPFCMPHTRFYYIQYYVANHTFAIYKAEHINTWILFILSL